MSEWISVKDRLPDGLTQIIACHEGWRVEPGWFSRDHTFLFECVYGPVTHWMPLPEPPEETIC